VNRSMIVADEIANDWKPPVRVFVENGIPTRAQ
jgi:hypothetical protein